MEVHERAEAKHIHENKSKVAKNNVCNAAVHSSNKSLNILVSDAETTLTPTWMTTDVWSSIAD
jgi:hypothetical protein